MKIISDTGKQERIDMYQKLVNNATNKVMIFGIALGNITKDTAGIQRCLDLGVDVQLIGLDPDFVNDAHNRQSLDSLLGESFSQKIINGYESAVNLGSNITNNSSGSFEYRVYNMLPTSNATMTDWDGDEAGMLFEHISETGSRFIQQFSGYHDVKDMAHYYTALWKEAKTVIKK